MLSPEEETLCVAFRRYTLLPLDDCLYALQATIPHLSRSALHRLFQRHDISRLPTIMEGKPKKKFKAYPIGYFHIDIAEVRTEEGKLYMFVAIDRTSKFAFARLVEKAGKLAAAQFLRDLIKAVPYQLHTVLTDNGVQFTNRSSDRYAGVHIFDRACAENDIEHRLTKINHPWTNGQVERMNRTLKEATEEINLAIQLDVQDVVLKWLSEPIRKLVISFGDDQSFQSAGAQGKCLRMITNLATLFSKLLGHTQVQTTARYVHLTRDSIQTTAARVTGSIGENLSPDRDAGKTAQQQ